MKTWNYILNFGAITGLVIAVFRLWAESVNVLDQIALTAVAIPFVSRWAVEIWTGNAA